MDFVVRTIWPDWSATRLIGEGSFGKVYEIVRSNYGIEEHCALKVISIPSSQAELQSLKNEGMDDLSATEYYRGLVDEVVQEIALMSKLKGNIHIVGYEDYAVIEHKESVGWDILIRMELLTDLPSYIRDHSLSGQDIVKLALDICDALEICQAQRIIHRDIKPDNIFVTRSGDFKLGDFGVARTIEKTVSGLSKKGTYTYMAPEVYKDEEYGATVDLYSLGIVIYKLLNHNREPFLPSHPQLVKYHDKNNALVQRMRGESFPSPVNAEPELAKIILKACAYQAEDRYQSPTQLKEALLVIQNGMTISSAAVLSSNQVAVSKTNSRTDSSVRENSNSTVYSQSSSSSSVQSDTSPSMHTAKSNSRNKGLWCAGTVLGWIGVAVWTYIAAATLPYLVIQTLAVLITQILCTVKAGTKNAGIIMLIFSISSLNIFNLSAGIVFLIYGIKSEKQKRLLSINKLSASSFRNGEIGKENSVRCKQCGNKIMTNAKFCNVCGAKQIMDGNLQKTVGNASEPEKTVGIFNSHPNVSNETAVQTSLSASTEESVEKRQTPPQVFNKAEFDKTVGIFEELPKK